MTQGIKLTTMYKSIYFTRSHMGISLSEIDNMIPYELDVFQSLWVIDERKRLEAIKKLRNKK